ncbi:protealysin inhibitor emfourin [Streptomyces sp. NPDC017936]|uniref:protealysin inhibitor emfourin n=1 Tax=Streptomyces sp. NPDC017936 TaxID=3365016 RepID=UPI0037A714A4
MRVRVTRSGGLLGASRRGELDTSGRPDAAELEHLAHEVLATARPPRTPAAAVPDAYRYTVTVEGDDRTAEFTDPGLSESQRELIERVLGEGA